MFFLFEKVLYDGTAHSFKNGEISKLLLSKFLTVTYPLFWNGIDRNLIHMTKV